ATRHGLMMQIESARQNLGLALRRRGVLDQACKLQAISARGFAGALCWWEAAYFGAARLEGSSRMYYARDLALAGDLTGACAEIDESLRLLAACPPQVAAARAVQAQITAARGDRDAALALARDAMAHAQTLDGVEEDG